MDTKKLNGMAFGTTVGILALFAMAVFDFGKVYKWTMVWPVILIVASMSIIGYNIIKDMVIINWDYSSAKIETKIDVAMMGVLILILMVIIQA